MAHIRLFHNLIIIYFSLISFVYADRLDPRYYFYEDFLFEKTIPEYGYGSKDCVKDAMRTFPLSANYYSHYVQYDLKLIEDIFPKKNISAIVFARKLTDEAYILPSDGDISPVLFLDSLIQKMCKRVRTDRKFYVLYNKNKDASFRNQIDIVKKYYGHIGDYHHYLLVQTID